MSKRSTVTPILQALYAGDTQDAAELAGRAESLSIFEVAALGDVHRMASMSLDSEQVNQIGTDGYTPLHLAAFFDRPHAAALLLRCHAGPKTAARNSSFVQPLHSAVAGRSTGVACMLLAVGVPPDPRQEGGFTPLMAAAQNGDELLVELLLASGADRAMTTEDGRLAYELAATAGHSELAARLGP